MAYRDFEVDHDMAANIQTYLDLVRDIVKSTGGTLMVEQKLPIGNLTGEEGAHGTADALIMTDDEIIVVDLKFGMGEKVDA